MAKMLAGEDQNRGKIHNLISHTSLKSGDLVAEGEGNALGLGADADVACDTSFCCSLNTYVHQSILAKHRFCISLCVKDGKRRIFCFFSY